jgi:hypothetical protein
MPLERCDAIPDLSDPNIVLGPRKRRPTKRVLENGDLLACKKGRAHASTADVSADKEGLTIDTDGTESSDDQASGGIQAIVVDNSDDEGSEEREVDEDEDDDAELGTWSDTQEIIRQLIDKLVRLQKDWDAPIYVFFKPFPSIQYIQSRKAHVFECAAIQCHCRTRFVRRFLDTSDSKSTSNLRRHAKVCWSEEAVQAADGTRDVRAARDALQNIKTVNGSITAAFQRVGEGKVIYSHRQHTKTESRYAVIVYTSGRYLRRNWQRGIRSMDHRKQPTVQNSRRPRLSMPHEDREAGVLYSLGGHPFARRQECVCVGPSACCEETEGQTY